MSFRLSNPLFVALMLLAFLCAFVLPARISDPPREELAGLFYPVARPARAVAGVLHRHFHRTAPIDLGSPAAPRPDETILQENQRLREQLSSLLIRYAKLAESSDARNLQGNILPYCRAVAVAGIDTSGGREALLIGSSSLAGLQPDDPVLYAPQALAGRVVRAGVSGAEVRLVTDPGFAETARIIKYVPDRTGAPQAMRVATLQPLVEGMGKGRMVIRSTVPWSTVEQLQIGVGDLLALDDPEWPPEAQGVSIGRITSLAPQPNAPLFAEIQVQPMANLMQLREVMVMVGK